MVTAHTTDPDALQFEALLNARAYLYEMFFHLTGGVPTADLFGVLSGDTVKDMIEEYEDFDGMRKLADLLSAYAKMNADEAEVFFDRAKDEYMRVFIGPAALPASPYESPYRGSHDMSLLQENTLAVRQAYRNSGYEPKKIDAIPDDHVAFMCSFMAANALKSLNLYESKDRAVLSAELIAQSEFANSHMTDWLSVFAESVATSHAASKDVLYPTVLRALEEFVRADRSFLLEGNAWLTEQSAPDPLESGSKMDCRADLRKDTECAFKEVKECLALLQSVKQLGLTDYALAQI